ncbi:MAG: undecaprenyl diphosphate synthase family protein [Clostridia bacterium]|nr:undecaprenyl diphosphate synthase family protein [Clostridia bacterium]
MRIPNHIGIIPDGNRRWAQEHSMNKEKGYENGLLPGLEAFRTCKALGVNELSIYGFTSDNTKRPTQQRIAFTKCCIEMINILKNEDCEILVAGNRDSNMFPIELSDLAHRKRFGKGGLKVNFLINYSWEWDLKANKSVNYYNTADISRIDLIIRWGGMRRLSGFLPVQSVYADFYIIDDLWPDFKKEHITQALEWYQNQDITLGG